MDLDGESAKPTAWIHLPLLVVALPSFGALIHGRAENWTDGLILIIACGVLYQMITRPWDLYDAAHTRIVVPPESVTQTEDVQRKGAVNDLARAALRRIEIVALILAVALPGVGAYFLWHVKDWMHDGDRYINKSTTTLFLLTTIVRPLVEIFQVLQRRVQFLQKRIHYPYSEVVTLQRRIEALEHQISMLLNGVATKEDVTCLRDDVDVPLTQLSRAMRKFDKREAFFRLSSEERFEILSSELKTASQDLRTHTELISQLQRDQIHLSKPFLILLEWFQRGPVYCLFWPLTITALAYQWFMAPPINTWSSYPRNSSPSSPTRLMSSYPKPPRSPHRINSNLRLKRPHKYNSVESILEEE